MSIILKTLNAAFIKDGMFCFCLHWKFFIEIQKQCPALLILEFRQHKRTDHFPTFRERHTHTHTKVNYNLQFNAKIAKQIFGKQMFGSHVDSTICRTLWKSKYELSHMQL